MELKSLNYELCGPEAIVHDLYTVSVTLFSVNFVTFDLTRPISLFDKVMTAALFRKFWYSIDFTEGQYNNCQNRVEKLKELVLTPRVQILSSFTPKLT